jgi:hypothetical protein
MKFFISQSALAEEAATIRANAATNVTANDFFAIVFLLL